LINEILEVSSENWRVLRISILDLKYFKHWDGNSIKGGVGIRGKLKGGIKV